MNTEIGTKKDQQSESDLKQLLCGDFDNDEQQRLYEIAKKYHDACDNFDKHVCSITNERGVAMPRNREEYIAVNRNALRVRRGLISENPDILPIEIQRAISNYRD